MCAAARASTTLAPHMRQFLINHAAIRNARNVHKNNALSFSNRLKLAYSGAFSSPRKRNVTNHIPLLVRTHSLSYAFLFNTNERTRKKANLFTTNKKQFLFRTFKRLLPVLFNTFEWSSIYPFFPPARHGRIAAL
jgi:hypothetical protein